MPQMAPLMWLNLLIVTLSTLLFLTILNYFTKTVSLEEKSEKLFAKSSKKWAW